MFFKKRHLIAICIFWICLFERSYAQSKNNTPEIPDIKLEDLGTLDKEKKLYIYTWFDQISPKVLEEFHKLTGIKVIVDVFDSNETLEAKLLTGNCNYDIVVTNAWPFFQREMRAGVFQKLNKSTLSKNVSLIDKRALNLLKNIDVKNEYALPFAWGVNGIGVNIKTIKTLAPDIALDTWGVLFNPDVIEKIKLGKVALLDSPDELFCAVFAYLGFPKDTLITKEQAEMAVKQLTKIRKYINKFDSYSFQDLANGSACAVMCSSGDLMFARTQTSKENAKNIKFIIPKEGGCLWLEVMAIPKHAKHYNNAHAFMNFLMHPKISSQITNYNGCASPIVGAKAYVSERISSDKTIYPDNEVLNNCYINSALPEEISQYISRALTKIKANIQ